MPIFFEILFRYLIFSTHRLYWSPQMMFGFVFYFESFINEKTETHTFFILK